MFSLFYPTLANMNECGIIIKKSCVNSSLDFSPPLSRVITKYRKGAIHDGRLLKPRA